MPLCLCVCVHVHVYAGCHTQDLVQAKHKLFPLNYNLSTCHRHFYKMHTQLCNEKLWSLLWSFWSLILAKSLICLFIIMSNCLGALLVQKAMKKRTLISQVDACVQSQKGCTRHIRLTCCGSWCCCTNANLPESKRVLQLTVHSGFKPWSLCRQFDSRSSHMLTTDKP